MRWFRVANLSTQITLLVAISLLLVVSGFAWMGFQSVRENTDRTLQERLVIAQVTAERTDELLERTTAMLEVAVGQVALDPDNPASPANQESLKFILPHLGQMVHYVALVNRAGVVVLSEPAVDGLVGSDVSTGKCIQKVLAGNDPMITKVFNLGKVSPSAAILVGVKGTDDSVAGLVYAALDLEHPTITNLLKPLGLGETGYAEILDQNGIILASTWPERLWQEADHNQRFARLIEESQTTVGTCHSCHPAGNSETRRQDVLAFAPLAAAPWGVAVRQSETEALAYSQTMERRVLFFGVGALLITLSCTWAITHGLGKPLHSLAHACHQIATGDLTEPITPAGSGEVRALALSFDTMREKLKASLDEIEGWNLSLEQKVEQRTRELEQAEQDRRELLRKLVAVQEEERRRLARELHDETSQALTALSVGLETAMIAPTANVNEVKERLIPIKSMAVEMLKEVQRIILDLRPSILDDLGLVQAIDWYAESRLKPQGIKVGLEVVGIELRLPSELETAVFRMAQEAISNIGKHAQAEHVNIGLEFTSNVVILDIEDDGRGFVPETALDGGRISQSFGLLGIRERAALFGGTMKISARPGHGTRVTVEIPWERLRSNGHNGYNGQEDTHFIGGRSRHFEGRPQGIAPSV